MDVFLTVLLVVSLGSIALPFAGTLMRNFIYFVIPLNLLADALIPFTGFGGIHSGHIRGAILLGFIIVSVYRLRPDRVTAIIILTLCYFAFVIRVFSTNLAVSMDTFANVFIAMMMFPVSYYTIRTWRDFKKLVIVIRLALIIIVVSFFIYQAFQIGSQDYRVAEAAFTGGSGIYPTYLVAYFGCLLPLLIRFSSDRKSRWLTVGLFCLGVLVMLLIFRRGPLLALALGALVHLTLSQWEVKARLLKLGAGLCLMLLLLLPPFWGKVEALYQHRVVEGIEQELGGQGGRKTEVGHILQVQIDRPVKQKFFGEELFNAYGNFDFTRRRAVHVDYMNILLGGGLVGLTLFVLIYGFMGWQFFQWQRTFPKEPVFDELKGAFWSLLVASLLLSATNQLWAITPYSGFFLLAGALMRLASETAREASGPARAVYVRSKSPVR